MTTEKMPDEIKNMVSLSEAGCWEWLGYIEKKGYGRYKKIYAHRYVYQMMVGDIPSELVTDHLCRNRKCVNPEHLELVTPRVNVERGISLVADNMRKTYCTRGHWLGGDNIRIVIRPDGTRRKCKACDRYYKAIKRDVFKPNRKRYPNRVVATIDQFLGDK